MGGIEVDRMISDLTSGELDLQIPALEQVCQVVDHLVKSAVHTLETGPERFLIAERLHRLGPTAVGPLESLLMNTENAEVRILGSLVLLQLGSRAGIHWLLKAVLEDHNYASLVVGHLAKNRVHEAVDGIIARLRGSDAADVDLIVSFLTALETLKVDVPSDLIDRFEKPSMPWQVRKVVDDYKANKAGT
jgi:hypothetical protein